MAKLTLQDAESTASRSRPWTFRMEFHGTTENGSPSHKYWYATGRGLLEAVEVGWGALGAPPQHQLINWTELRARVADKLAKGYTYANTGFVRMSSQNIALLQSGQVPVTSTPVTPPTTKPSLQSLGEPYSLIQTLRIKRDGTKITGYTALDAQGGALLDLDAKTGLDLAIQYDLEVVFC